MSTVNGEELCAHCGERMPVNGDRYRYCSDLCSLLARDITRRECQRTTWEALLPMDPLEDLVRNPHSLDGLGMAAGERLFITREEFDAMDDARSKAWRNYVRRVALANR